LISNRVTRPDLVLGVYDLPTGFRFFPYGDHYDDFVEFKDVDKIDFLYPFNSAACIFTCPVFTDLNGKKITNFKFTGIIFDLDIREKIMRCSSKQFVFKLHEKCNQTVIYSGSLMDDRIKQYMYTI
jgi:hypothetical protein